MSASPVRDPAGPVTNHVIARHERHDDHDRREDPADDVGRAGDGGLRSLRLLDEPDDLLERRVPADFRRGDAERARLVHRAGEDGVPGGLVDREALAGEHGFVDVGRAFLDAAVDRDPLAGPDDDAVSRDEVRDRDLDLAALAEHARGIGGEMQQARDGVAGAAASARFERASDEDQRDDGGRRFEVDRGVSFAAGGHEHVRRDRRDRRRHERHAGPDGHERVHVGARHVWPRPSRC